MSVALTDELIDTRPVYVSNGNIFAHISHAPNKAANTLECSVFTM